MEIEALLQGKQCCGGLIELAKAHPELAPQLLAIAQCIAADLQAAASSSSSSAAAAPGGDGAASSSAKSSTAAPTAAAVARLPPGFATLKDVSCITPRGKHDVEFTESGFTLIAKGAAAATTPPVVVPASIANGVFSLQIKDKYKTGPAGITHLVVITLASPVMLGKTPHKAIAFSESGAALAKAGSVSVLVSRPIATAGLKDAKALGLASGDGAGASISGEDSFAVLRRLLTSVFGKLGEEDKGVFCSSAGQASVKCYHKVNDGVLFPLRRAFIFGPRPLVCLPHSEIAGVSVGRSGGAATRTFDFDVTTLDGKTVQFSMLENDELEPLRKYVSTRSFGSAAAAAATSAASSAGAAAGVSNSSSSSSSPAAASSSSAAAADGRSDSAAALAEDEPTAAKAITTSPVVVNMNEGESDDDADGDGAGQEGGSDDDDDEDGSDSEYGGKDSDSDEDDDDDDDDGSASEATEGEDEDDAEEKAAAASDDEDEGAASSDGSASEADADMSDDELKALLDDAKDDTQAAAAAGGRGALRPRRAAAAASSSSSSSAAAAAAEDDEEGAPASKKQRT